MERVQKRWWNRRGIGALAFVIVLLLMPLGHTLMVLMQQLFGDHVLFSAFLVGALGVVCLWWGVMRSKKALQATLLGAIGGVLTWTGWVEFSFVWIAEKLNVAPLIEDGVVRTKPEYLVMMSSLGLLGTMCLPYVFSSTRCTFFHWIQKSSGIKKVTGNAGPSDRPLALITFMEMVMLVWTFYVVLLLCYDKDIAGDRHPITWIVAFGSLAWSIWLFSRLLRIKSFDHAIRYAIPTVVIFWNFVEILGRWDLYQEIWVHPFEHWLENSLILGMMIGFTLYFTIKGRNDKQRRSVARPQHMAHPKQAA